MVQGLMDVIWKVGEQRRLREEKQQLEEMESGRLPVLTLRWSL